MPAIGPNAYPFDPSGSAPSNLVTGEVQIVTAVNSNEYHIVVPNFAPFYRGSLVVLNGGPMTPLVEGVDFIFTHKYKEASINTAIAVYGSITLLNKNFSGVLMFQQYQTVGGDWTLTTTQINQILADKLLNPRITTWEQLGVAPEHFPVINHLHVDPEELIGMPELVQAVEDIAVAVDNININVDLGPVYDAIDGKVQDSLSPTSTTIAPSVRAVNEALDLKADLTALDGYVEDSQIVQNLTGPTATNIPSTDAVATALNLKVDDSQIVQNLTSPNATDIPSTDAVANALASVGPVLTISELYPTLDVDKGDIIIKGNPSSGAWELDVSASKIRLSITNVDNTSDANKPISLATQAALDAKVYNTQIVQDLNTPSTTNVPSVDAVSGILADKANDNAVVHLTGNESIDDVKTFTATPQLPDVGTDTTNDSNNAASTKFVQNVFDKVLHLPKFHVRDELADGTGRDSGGAGNTWRGRPCAVIIQNDLTTANGYPINAVNAGGSGEYTLPNGKYRLRGWATFRGLEDFRLRLLHSLGTTLVLGGNTSSDVNDGGVGFISGDFLLNGGSGGVTVTIENWYSSRKDGTDNNRYGKPSNSGELEVYSEFIFEYLGP